MKVREYVLPDGRTFQFTEEEAKKVNARPVNRAVSLPANAEIAESAKSQGKKDVKKNGNSGTTCQSKDRITDHKRISG